MNHVFQFWTGPMPAWIATCLDTVRQRSAATGWSYHLVNDANFTRYVPESMFNGYGWRTLKPGVQSDVIRAAVLHQWGGLYLDADTVMLASPDKLNVGDEDAIYCKWNRKDKAVAGYVYLKADTAITRFWTAAIRERLAKGVEGDGWMQLGEEALTPALAASTNTRQVPLHTFLPIDIDAGWEMKRPGTNRFFTPERWQDSVKPETICFGLNFSYMERGWLETMKKVNAGGDGPELIYQLMRHARQSVRPLRIAVLCCTYNRPKLLGHVVRCFERQRYDRAVLEVLNDGPPLGRSDFRVTVMPGRAATLGQKRNYAGQIAWWYGDVDAYVVWDDDDLYLPWALEAIADGLRWADWTRPSQVLVRHGDRFDRMKTYWRPDMDDRAFQCSWGVMAHAFHAVGGYPDDLSHGEDLGLAKRLLAANVSQSDPIALGWDPYYVYGPFDNQHFGWEGNKDYAAWGEQCKPEGEFKIVDPPWALDESRIGNKVLDRPFKGDWLGSDQR